MDRKVRPMKVWERFNISDITLALLMIISTDAHMPNMLNTKKIQSASMTV
jgi:hypothetical protein